MIIEDIKPGMGKVPAVALVNPKYPHNVGAATRAASCYGAKQVWWTGNRVFADAEKGHRLPREERMKGYNAVDIIHGDYFFDAFNSDVTPVAIELRENAEPLHTFEHPENALYVFGPEDGSLGKPHVNHCHRFVVIPSYHCLNLAAAVYTVLYDRMAKLGPVPTLAEDRGFIEPDDMCEVLQWS